MSWSATIAINQVSAILLTVVSSSFLVFKKNNMYFSTNNPVLLFLFQTYIKEKQVSSGYGL